MPSSTASIVALPTRPEVRQNVHLQDTHPGPPSSKSQGELLMLEKYIQDKKRMNSDFRDRCNAMDKAIRAGIKEVEDCGETLSLLQFPLVMSSLDTSLAQLTSTYLSGSPIFPVVATPDQKDLGYKIEQITDSHSRAGHWGREFILFFRQLLKYNIACLEVSWRGSNSFSTLFDTLSAAPQYEPTVEYINSLKAPDMYNTLWDYRVDPARISRDGEWAGYNEIIPRQQLIKEMSVLSQENKLFNHQEALAQTDNWNRAYWWEHPVVSEYSKTHEKQGWRSWLPNPTLASTGSGLYFRTILYVRITPSDYSLSSDSPSQIWKLITVNNKVLISAEPIITFEDVMPINFGQYSDDNLGIRFPSEVEYVQPFQNAATELLNNRMASSKRSTADRLLYDKDLVNGKHIASKNPSARIPVNMAQNAMGKRLGDAVAPIPFTDTGAGTVMQDIRMLAGLPELITGNNSADEGRFRKGNRTLGEFNEIMQNSSDRSMYHPVSLEEQVFRDIKNQLKFNLVTRLDTSIEEMNPALSETITLTPEEIRANIMRFRFADGVQPKSLIANTQMWGLVWQGLLESGLLQIYDAPAIYEYISSLGGVHGLEKFRLQGTGLPTGGPAPAAGGQGVPNSAGAAEGAPPPELPT